MGRKKNLLTVAQEGNRRDLLIALRDRLCRALDTTNSGRDVAALSKRLIEVTEEIESLPDPAAKQNPVRQAQARAANRQTGKKSP